MPLPQMPDVELQDHWNRQPLQGRQHARKGEDEEKGTSSLARSWVNRRADAGIGGLSSLSGFYSRGVKRQACIRIAPASVDRRGFHGSPDHLDRFSRSY